MGGLAIPPVNKGESYGLLYGGCVSFCCLGVGCCGNQLSNALCRSRFGWLAAALRLHGCYVPAAYISRYTSGQQRLIHSPLVMKLCASNCAAMIVAALITSVRSAGLARSITNSSHRNIVSVRLSGILQPSTVLISLSLPSIVVFTRLSYARIKVIRESRLK